MGDLVPPRHPSGGMTPENAAALRKPFDPKAIGKLPKAGLALDYVGHAATTDRLLAVDPHWTWEPMAKTVDGLPLLDSKGNLWIRLTVCGVTRIGVGDGPNAKVVIGDAIRNAAMRFGVALDLWSKEELEQVHAEPEPRTITYEQAKGLGDGPPRETPKDDGPGITDDQRKKLHALANDLGLDRDLKLVGIAATIGRPVESSNDLTKAEASQVIDRMQSTLDARLAAAADGEVNRT